jgi:hypothetical protein
MRDFCVRLSNEDFVSAGIAFFARIGHPPTLKQSVLLTSEGLSWSGWFR